MFIRWRNKESGCAWFIRNVESDGKFYGDITDSNRMRQRNFCGEINSESLDDAFQLYREIKLKNNVFEIVDGPLLFTTIGHDLKAIDYQGKWRLIEDIPNSILQLVNLLSPCILMSLKLSNSDVSDEWRELLAK
ncbi:MAG: hypothetical protein WCI02_18965 [Planctomycetota bacterium]